MNHFKIFNFFLVKRSNLFFRTSSSHNAVRVKTESGQEPAGKGSSINDVTKICRFSDPPSPICPLPHLCHKSHVKDHP